ncbi:MAG: lipoyl(octanoyl) transferase LipB [Propionibacteriaceae bacterium]|nr:lipoyl(octanoyl) transferase LipB [Propionibacteriaceae bacterium]
MEFRYLGLGEHLADYRATLAEQRRVHALVASGELPAQVLFVEHAPVYTAGRRTLPQERPADGSEVIEVDRGGKITYHGPGQLVGYPIAFVPWKVGVVDYVRMLEEALIGLLADYGLQGIRVPGRTGVWLDKPQRKIAAIGIRVSHQTTLHGFALNVSDDLAAFQKIIPCGIDDAGVTSLGRELGETPPLLAVAQRLEPHLRAALKGRIAG